MIFFLYQVVYGVVIGAVWLLSPFSRKARLGISGRRGLVDRIKKERARFSKAPLWFHVASSGELEQCFPLLDELRSQRPEIPLFLTYFSPTARRGLELEKERRTQAGLAISWDYADYAPYDFTWTVSAFLKALAPSHFIAIHREIWPGVLRECRKRGIHCHLFATYFPPRSQRWLPLLSPSLRQFETIGTNEAATANALREFLAPSETKIEIIGDPRVERVLKRRQMQKSPHWVKYFDGQNVLVLASLWPKDFEKIALGVESLLKSGEPWRIIAVPHEPENVFVEKCLNFLSGARRKSRRWSEWSPKPDRDSHLVVDSVGLLAELYRIATLVFVGGSFRARVHNVLEPAAYGKPILTGPYIENSGEAMELWHAEEALVRSNDEASFRDALALLARRPELRRQSAEIMASYLRERSQVSPKYVSCLLESL